MPGPRSQPRETFPSTHWSEVRAAAGGDGALARSALAQLLRRYLPALKIYLARKRGLSADAADDFLQTFVEKRVLEGDFVAAADRNRGKFRSFLLTSLDHYLIDQIRRQRAGTSRIPIGQFNDSAPDDRFPVTGDRPDAFDIAWAQQVIHATLDHMQSECNTSGRVDLWSLFDLRVVGPTLRNEPAPTYAQLVARFDFESPTQASNALVTAKRMFERTLRSVVMQYAGSPASIDGEIRDLKEILSRAGARSA